MEQKFKAQNKKLYEVIIEQFGKLLASGEYKVGDKLPPLTSLAKMFGVGVSSLREALSVLASTGVIEICHGKGTFIRRLTIRPNSKVVDRITGIDENDILSWMEFRRIIEVEAIGLATKRRNEVDICELEDLVIEIEDRFNKDESIAKLDFEFHLRIILATNNDFFINAFKNNEHMFKLEGELYKGKHSPNRKEIIMREHRKIIESITEGDVNKARNTMRTHLLNFERKTRILNMDL